MQANDLQIAVYSYRFITETLFPNEQFKSQDVAKGGKLYCLTQVFLDKIDPEEKAPVELLFISRTSDTRFKKYPKCQIPAVSKTIAETFNKLTHKAKNPSQYAESLCNALHHLRDTMKEKVAHAQIDEKFKQAFEAVETCLRKHPEKVATFDTILDEWTLTSPGFRARATDSDPFIKELQNAIQNI